MSDSFARGLERVSAHDAQRKVRTVSLAELGALCDREGLSLNQGGRAALAHDVTPLPLLKSRHGISRGEQAALLDSTVLLVGAGGLGGYVLELLARFGVGRILVADGDVFEESNLNRQLLSSVADLGRNKARVAAERVARIAPLVDVQALEIFLDRDNLPRALQGVGVVVDALGGIAPRMALHDVALGLKIPVVAAAVAGWTVVVGSETFARRGISRMWSNPDASDAEHALGSLSPAVSLAAALMAAEASRYLLKGELQLAGRMLHADLASFSFEIYDLE
ncbi:MAG: thiamine biosynthesis protein ThiF [Deltaproteobacteria bacterium HGW-Deltaproteobacteria-18]|jgi:molybdopterin/thiamine biosynthesis adenylyltransferase|nr:MAG: thiamine biosynthesis protein ThiF [Deltaproteobacteria bacterium HGW-Deltaproteobacteria-18]